MFRGSECWCWLRGALATCKQPTVPCHLSAQIECQLPGCGSVLFQQVFGQAYQSSASKLALSTVVRHVRFRRLKFQRRRFTADENSPPPLVVAKRLQLSLVRRRPSSRHRAELTGGLDGIGLATTNQFSIASSVPSPHEEPRSRVGPCSFHKTNHDFACPL